MSDETTPAADYDSPWKEALARYLPDAFALFFPAFHAQVDWRRGYVLLDKELQRVTRDADLGRRLADTLVKIWRQDGSDAWVLIHVEVQGQPERDFARRMFVYYYRIFDHYDHPIMSVAILGDEQADWRPSRFSQELWGCAVELRYPVVKLLDELFRLIDWLVALPAEQERLLWREVARIEEERRMPYVTSVERIGLQEGRAQGLQEGKAQGLQEGRLQGQRAVLRRLVQARFGAVPAALGHAIDTADEERLGELTDRIGAASSLADLVPQPHQAE
jgi:hypothetical protein